MDHVEIKNKLSEYRDDELPPAEHQAIKTHLLACDGCQKQLQNWTKLSERLFPATPLKPTRDLTLAVLEQIGVSQAKPRRVPAYWLAPAVGIAAVLVLSINPLQTLNHVPQNLTSTDDVYSFLLTDNSSDSAAIDLIFAAG